MSIEPALHAREPRLWLDTQRSLATKEPLLWLNTERRPLADAGTGLPLNRHDLSDAHLRARRFAPLLRDLFPELASTGGIIESPLVECELFRAAMLPGEAAAGRWLIKCDHALAVAGSIKARGGIFEVLAHAEELALKHQLLSTNEDRRLMAGPQARARFAAEEIVVGSTGNLGLSIGVLARTLGFKATVHMSREAKPWKKERLKSCEVQVMEHQGDYETAVATAREQAKRKARTYFVDDENSNRLFLGYSLAAFHLKDQLAALHVRVDATHPLFVYLPCGVGGAPGGITFGLRHLLGDNVHCFLAEPVSSPCMLLRLASPTDRAISVREIGLDNLTEADGLAVAKASELAAKMLRPLVSGVFTVPDEALFEGLHILNRTEGLRIEPSAAAGFRGPVWLLRSDAGQSYLRQHGLMDHMQAATHILWTTGGALVPEEEYRHFHDRGRAAGSTGAATAR